MIKRFWFILLTLFILSGSVTVAQDWERPVPRRCYWVRVRIDTYRITTYRDWYGACHQVKTRIATRYEQERYASRKDFS